MVAVGVASLSGAFVAVTAAGADDLAPPTITSADATTFVVSDAGSFTVTTTPGTDQNDDGLVSISESGALPDDVTFVDNGDGTATLAGTPADATDGTYPITITASNGVEPDATQDFTLTVDPVAAPTSVTVTGPDSQVVGTTYTATSAASGANVAPTYSFAPGAPSWLSIDPNSGDISGTIPEGNPPYYGYSVTATDSAGSATSDEQFVTIDMGNSALDLEASPSGPVAAGVPVTFTATVSETEGSGALSGTISFTKGNANVSNCQNLSLHSDAAHCTITFPQTGFVNVTATYQNDPFFNPSFASVLEQVVSGQKPVFTSASGTTATVGTGFSFSVTATGTPEPTITESGALPSGVTFQSGAAGSATISGTPAVGSGGKYPVTLTASSSGGTATQNFTLSVDEPSSITSAPSASGSIGTALSFKIKTSGFPAATVTESGALPSGVTFTAKANGSATLTGTPGPGTGGSYPLTLSASNGIGSASTQDFVLTIDQSPVFTSASNTTATVGSSIDFTVSASGSPPPAITEKGALPAGLAFGQVSPGSASITGVPAAHTGGRYTITLKATGSGSATQTFILTVDQAPAITSAAKTTAATGTAFSFKVTTTGFPASLVAESGALPSGVTFTAKSNGTATIAGTAAAGTGGTYDVTLTASNGVGSPATQAFVLKITG